MPTALHVSLIVSRDSRIISHEHARDETDFADGNLALAYVVALQQWLDARPTADNLGTWRLPVREVAVDMASPLAAELGRILAPRDASLFPDTDAEAISSQAEKRPYDAERKAA